MNRAIFQQVYKIWLLSLVDRFNDFKNAAYFAGISVSALNQSLSSLEDFFNKNLIIKKRSQPALTEFGLSLINDYKDIIADLEVKALAGQTPSIKKIKIGSYESLALKLTPKIFSKIQNAYPGINVEVITERSQGLVKMIREGEVDFALAVDVEDSDGFFFRYNL